MSIKVRGRYEVDVWSAGISDDPPQWRPCTVLGEDQHQGYRILVDDPVGECDLDRKWTAGVEDLRELKDEPLNMILRAWDMVRLNGAGEMSRALRAIRKADRESIASDIRGQAAWHEKEAFRCDKDPQGSLQAEINRKIARALRKEANRIAPETKDEQQEVHGGVHGEGTG